MSFSRGSVVRPAILVAATAVLTGFAGALIAACGPFSDVDGGAMCPLVEEIFYLGITTGTTPATYDPAGEVNRLQMAAFLSRTVDTVIHRGSRRAALGQFWTPRDPAPLSLTTVKGGPEGLQSDGADVWVANHGGNDSVSRVRASDGRLLETWTGSNGGSSVLIAMGKVFTAGWGPTGGRLYQIDPTEPAGTVTRVVSSGLGDAAGAIAFDGSRIWAAAYGPAKVFSVTPGPAIPWTVAEGTATFVDLRGLTWDGTNLWATDYAQGTLHRLDSAGAVLQTVTVQSKPLFPLFDGANVLVPNSDSGSISIVRAATGALLATVTGNGLWVPMNLAFDGERVLVVNGMLDRVSLFRAADFAPLGFFYLPQDSRPWGVCSDGVSFWISLNWMSSIARF